MRKRDREHVFAHACECAYMSKAQCFSFAIDSPFFFFIFYDFFFFVVNIKFSPVFEAKTFQTGQKFVITTNTFTDYVLLEFFLQHNFLPFQQRFSSLMTNSDCLLWFKNIQ